MWAVTNDIRDRHLTMCQPSRPSLKWVERRPSPKWVERRCASKNTGPKVGGFVGGPTSIGGRKERASEDTGPRRGWIVMSQFGWGGEQT